MSLPKYERYNIMKRDNFTCQYCGAKSPEVQLEVDHMIPKSKGGQDTPDNLITACINCNRGKRDSVYDALSCSPIGQHLLNSYKCNKPVYAFLSIPVKEIIKDDLNDGRAENE